MDMPHPFTTLFLWASHPVTWALQRTLFVLRGAFWGRFYGLLAHAYPPNNLLEDVPAAITDRRASACSETSMKSISEETCCSETSVKSAGDDSCWSEETSLTSVSSQAECEPEPTGPHIDCWPELLQYLENGCDDDGNEVRLDLTCSVCNKTRLLLPPDLMLESDKPAENIHVYVCGHFFCASCSEDHAVRATSCPVCHYEFRHEKCGCAVQPKEFDVERPANHQVPRTLLEGGSIPPFCIHCLAERTANRARKFAGEFAIGYGDKFERHARRASVTGELVSRGRRLSISGKHRNPELYQGVDTIVSSMMRDFWLLEKETLHW